MFGLALGYEDVNDHDHLRHDPLLGVLLGKLSAKRSDCAAIACKSTPNRLELSRPEPTKYHRISHDEAAIENLLVDLFVEAQRQALRQIVLDLDATDDPLHGHQEGRFFHGYVDTYCYLPLYVTCGRHLLAAKLRRSNIDGSAGAEQELDRIVGRIRARWPRVRILVRADSGFIRERLMAWCEAHGVDFVFGLARNKRLAKEIEWHMACAEAESQRTGQPARRFKDFQYATRQSWRPPPPRHRPRPNEDLGRTQPTLHRHLAQPRRGRGPPALREALLRSRRHGEPHQGMPDRHVRRPHLSGDHARQPTPPVAVFDDLCATLCAAPHRAQPYPPRQGVMRLRSAWPSCKIGAVLTTSVRRVNIAMASGCPCQLEFRQAHALLTAAAR